MCVGVCVCMCETLFNLRHLHFLLYNLKSMKIANRKCLFINKCIDYHMASKKENHISVSIIFVQIKMFALRVWQSNGTHLLH